MDAPTDEQLLRDYLDGAAASFELLVRRHARELGQFVQRFTGNFAAAEDVVQETFLQVHTSASRFDPTRKFKPWLFTIAANKARDYLRRRDRKREVPFEAPINGAEVGGKRFIEFLSDVPTDPEDDRILEEKRRLVRLVVSDMPEGLREMLILAYYHRFPYRDMAEIIGIPLGTVKSRLHTAVLRFAECYHEAVEEQARQEP